MRVALLGLCVISILQLTVAVQPALNLDQLLETTDDEDIVWYLHKQQQGRVRRRAPDVNAPAMSAMSRERRDTGDTGGGDGGAPIAFNDPVITNDVEGSGQGSGEGPDDNFST